MIPGILPLPLGDQPSSALNRSRRFRQCAAAAPDQCHGIGLSRRKGFISSAMGVLTDDQDRDLALDRVQFFKGLDALAIGQKQIATEHNYISTLVYTQCLMRRNTSQRSPMSLVAANQGG